MSVRSGVGTLCPRNIRSGGGGWKRLDSLGLTLSLMSKKGVAATGAVWLLHKFGNVEVEGVAGNSWDSSFRGLQMLWSEVIGSWPLGSAGMVNAVAELEDPQNFGGKGSSGPRSDGRVQLVN